MQTSDLDLLLNLSQFATDCTKMRQSFWPRRDWDVVHPGKLGHTET